MELFKLLGTIAIDTADMEKAFKRAREGGAEVERSFSGSFAKIGSTIGAVGKLAAAGVVAAGTAIGGFVTKSVQAYASYEQLVGGVDTLFKGSSKLVQQYADQAYKTAGLSANNYMETVTSFSGSLLQSLGGDTKKAAEYGNLAILDMSDNANKMGTSMESIQYAYQGFAKQNYTMLDNLKLGYGGTKSEMERLIDDANKLKVAQGETADLTIDSYADVIEAIHLVQTEMGITGTTAKEAEGTITGSIAMTKGAWENLMTGLARDNADIPKLVSNVVTSGAKVIQNIIPVAKRVLQNLPAAISEISPKAGKAFQGIVDICLGAWSLLEKALKPTFDLIVNIFAFISDHTGLLMGVATSIGVVAAAIGLYNAVAAIKHAMAVAEVATVWGLVAAYAGQAVAMMAALAPYVLIVAAIGAVIAAVVVMYNKFDWFKNFVDGFVEKLKSGWEAIKEGAIAMKDRLVEAWNEIKARCEPLVQAIKENLIGAFEDAREKGRALGEKLGELKEKFQPIADLLQGAFKTAISDASAKFDEIKGKIGDFAEGALTKLNDGITKVREGFEKFSEFAGRLWDNLDPVVTLIRDNLISSLENLKEPIQTIKDAFGLIGDTINNSLLPALRDALMPVWESLKSALSGVAGILGGLFIGALGLAVGAINGIVSAISGFAEAFSGIVEIVANVFSLIVGIFTLDGQKIKDACIGIKDGVVKVFSGLWDAVSGFVKGFVDGVVGFFKGLWDTLVGHSIVPDTINGIVNCFAGLWGKVKGLVSNFKNGVVNAFNGAKTKVISIATNIKDKVSSTFNNLKSKASSIFNNLKSDASSKWESIKSTISSKAENIKSKVSTTFNNAKTAAVNAFNNMKSNVSSSASNILSTVTSKFNSVKTKISSAVESAKSKAVSAFSSMKSTISSHVSSAYSTIASKFDSIKSKVSSVMSSAKSLVSDGMAAIKKALSGTLSFPKIKLPHFKISGSFSLDPPSVPKISVSWYKKAMQNAMLLNSPTIFGYSAASGKFLGGGEAGSEVVAGSQTLMNMIQTAVAEQNGGMADRLDALIDLITRYLPEIAINSERQFVFDTGATAGALAPAMDRELGKLSSRKDRGR